jgi:hypothetical protein
VRSTPAYRLVGWTGILQVPNFMVQLPCLLPAPAEPDAPRARAVAQPAAHRAQPVARRTQRQHLTEGSSSAGGADSMVASQTARIGEANSSLHDGLHSTCQGCCCAAVKQQATSFPSVCMSRPLSMAALVPGCAAVVRHAHLFQVLAHPDVQAVATPDARGVPTPTTKGLLSNDLLPAYAACRSH